MELPNIGQHCSKSECKKLDFLPIKCDACSKIFCDEHYLYLRHDCVNSYLKNNQVPVCPLCNIPIPIPQGQQPDQYVGAHIDNDCQSDPAKNKRKVFTNRCSLKGCKIKEVIPVLCNECGMNFCLKHRHPTDHQCAHKRGGVVRPPVETNGNMSEDEALARALALSMQEESSASWRTKHNMTQEDMDLALARQLQESEYQGQGATTARSSNQSQSGSGHRDRCSVA